MTDAVPLRFIDLFAGLGGFHLALSELGHRCVLASEVDEGLRALYRRNFGVDDSIVKGDIREIDVERDIPPHDILCAGFPCQPFSKAGDQQGFDCPRWGDLFQFVLDTIRVHRPGYLILENVPNIKKHARGATWEAILRELRQEGWGYEVAERLLSPHEFGIPQVRQRVFIVGSRSGLGRFRWPEPTGQRPELWRILNRGGHRDPGRVRRAQADPEALPRVLRRVGRVPRAVPRGREAPLVPHMGDGVRSELPAGRGRALRPAPASGDPSPA